MKTQVEKILILAKTYPSPSSQYIETSCVAGITQRGEMRRLYPVPFRLIEEGKQFKKWQWVDVRTQKASKDHRIESHRLFVDTISPGVHLSAKQGWCERFPWIDRIPCFTHPDQLDTARENQGVTLALLKPTEVLGLDIKKARNPDWTQEEKEKLVREQTQGNLFTEEEAQTQVRELRKIPFDFYYRYRCGASEHQHKIVDWEAGALYWNCQKYGDRWEERFRAKLEVELSNKNLMFLMGNIHRFPAQWLIISLIYPPKPAEDNPQDRLF